MSESNYHQGVKAGLTAMAKLSQVLVPGQRVAIDKGRDSEMTGTVVAGWTATLADGSGGLFYTVDLDQDFKGYVDTEGKRSRPYVSWLVVHADNLKVL